MASNTFFKLAHMDGYDFYTGKTINFRENIGKIVRVPNIEGLPELCSDTVLHASRKPNDTFVGVRGCLPYSMYIVKGKPVIQDDKKCGFKEFFIVEEIPQDTFDNLLGWLYSQACNPINPFKLQPPTIGKTQIELLRSWDSVWASLWAYIGSLFPNIKKWCYIKYKRGTYPFQPAVDLWKMGLVSSFDGAIWRLHGGEKATVLFTWNPKEA